MALRVEGRILPTYNAVCALRDAADDAATDGVVSPQSSTATCRVLTHAGMSIHEVCFMCSRLAEFGRHIAAADMLRKAGSASPEAQETVRFLSRRRCCCTSFIAPSPAVLSELDMRTTTCVPSAAFFAECEGIITRAACTRR